MTKNMEVLADLLRRLLEAKDACDAVNGDLRLAMATLDCKVLELGKLHTLVKVMHNDHQSTRQIVVLLLAEVEALIPKP